MKSLMKILCLIMVLFQLSVFCMKADNAYAWVTIYQDNPSWDGLVWQLVTNVYTLNFSSVYSSQDSPGFGTMWGNVINNGVIIWFNPYFVAYSGNPTSITSGTVTYTATGYYIDGSQKQSSYTYNISNFTIGSKPGYGYLGSNIYVGQQSISLPPQVNGNPMSWWKVTISVTLSGSLTAAQYDPYTTPPYYGYLDLHSNIWASYSEATNAADQPTAQAALNAANTAATNATNAMNAANNAATYAQQAATQAQNAANNTWYNGQSAAYWASVAANNTSALVANIPPAINKVQGQNGATCTTGNSFTVVISATPSNGVSYRVTCGSFDSGWVASNTITITGGIVSGANTASAYVKNSAGATAQTSFTFFKV